MTSDPLGLAAGLNTYGYAAQNPLSFYDPDGRILPAVILAIQIAATLWAMPAAYYTGINLVAVIRGTMEWQEFGCYFV